MKKHAVAITLIAVLWGILFAGCTQNKEEEKAQTAAESFLKIYYTVDAQTVSNYNNSQDDTIKSIGNNFRGYVLTSEYNSFVANRYYNYYEYVRYCAEKKMVMAPVNFQLKMQRKQINSYDFQYDVTYSLTPDGGITSEITSTGNMITMTKENGSWKMSYIRGNTLT